MFCIIDRYVAKIVLRSTMTVLFILTSLSGIIKFVEQLRKIGEGTYGALDGIYYTLFCIPKDFEVFFPMAALLGGVLGLSTLLQFNELVVMQALGFTRIRLVSTVIKGSLFLLFFSMIITEFVAPQTGQIGREYRAKKLYGDTLAAIKGGLWVKEKDCFIHIGFVKEVKHLKWIRIYRFGTEGRLLSMSYASVADWNSNKKVWILSEIHESNLEDVKHIRNFRYFKKTWKTNLTPEKLKIISINPDILSIRGLFSYSRYLEQTGQKSIRYQLNMWRKIFQPLSIMVMILTALSFVFGPLHTVTMGIRFLIGISFGFIFYILDHVSSPLVLVYGIPAELGAILPSIFFLFISLFFLIKK